MLRRSLAVLFALIALAPLRADVCRPYTTGNGYARYLPTTAKFLTSTPTAGVTLPSDATGAVLFVNTASIRYRTDGVAPTASEGVLVLSGRALVFDADHATQLRTFQFIEVTSGAEVTVSYCSGNMNK
jgi:hypothetical protein